jgi:hypothetical protein
MSSDLVVLLILFFPGFLVLKIIEGLTTTKRRTEVDKLATAVGACLLVYLLYLGLSVPLRLPQIPVCFRPDGLWPIRVNAWSVLVIVVLSIVVGLVASRGVERGYAQWANKLFHVTRKEIGSPQGWARAFEEKAGGWASFYLRDGRVLEGIVEWYSDDPEYQEVFIKEACIHENGVEKEVAGPGILITKSTPVDYVVFLDVQKIGG